MLFGLINILASFHVYINKTLHLYLNVFAFVYLDNILIYTKSERKHANKNNLIKEHISQIKLVLRKLKQFNLYID